MGSFEAISAPPPQLVEFVQRMVRETVYARVEERKQDRQKIAIEVMVQPLDPDFQPTGEPFIAMTRDISSAGLGLFHTRAVPEKHLLVKLKVPSGGEMAVVLEVVRCRATGLFYDLGGYFVAKEKLTGAETQT